MARSSVGVSELFTWRTAIKRSDLPSSGKLLAMMMTLYMNEAGKSAFPGIDMLVKDTRLSRSAVVRWRTTLEELGWLALVRQGGIKGEERFANVYESTTPVNYLTSWADAPQDVKDRALDRKSARGSIRGKRSTGAATRPVEASEVDLNRVVERTADDNRTGPVTAPVDEGADDAVDGNEPPDDGSGDRSANPATGRVRVRPPVPTTSCTTPTTTPLPPVGGDVASDATLALLESDPEESTLEPPTEPAPDDSLAGSAEELTPEPTSGPSLFAVICEGMGWASEGVPADLRTRIEGPLGVAKRCGISPARLADLMWAWRAEGKSGIGNLAGALADLNRNETVDRLLPHRAEAESIVRATCEALNLDECGRCDTRQRAEWSVALLLAAGHPVDKIRAVLVDSPGWLPGQLTTAMSKTARPLAAVPDPAPEDLDVCSAADLVALMRRGLPPFDVARVASVLQAKIDAATAQQRNWLRRELQTGVFPSENLVSAAVQALLEKLRPIDPARAAEVAADLAVFDRPEVRALTAGGAS